jgi:hypothetical protein
MLATVLPSPAMKMSSHVGDDVAESCWRRYCRGDLVVARCRCRVMLATILSSHAGDDAVGVTWPRRDVDGDSCWRQCCRVMLATTLSGDLAVARCRCRVMLATKLPSHEGNDAVGATWPRRDVDAESCW